MERKIDPLSPYGVASAGHRPNSVHPQSHWDLTRMYDPVEVEAYKGNFTKKIARDFTVSIIDTLWKSPVSQMLSEHGQLSFDCEGVRVTIIMSYHTNRPDHDLRQMTALIGLNPMPPWLGVMYVEGNTSVRTEDVALFGVKPVPHGSPFRMGVTFEENPVDLFIGVEDAILRKLHAAPINLIRIETYNRLDGFSGVDPEKVQILVKKAAEEGINNKYWELSEKDCEWWCRHATSPVWYFKNRNRKRKP